MILAINENLKDFDKVDSASFVNLNIWERKHIQEWIRNNPEMLGEELLVVSIEFDKFVNTKDRSDILAVDREGNLVIVELKRDNFAEYADLQAIRYAAMLSSMTIEKLVPYYADYIKKYTNEKDISLEDAQSRIEEFVDDFSELTNKPHIILCSADFSQELTTTVLWLNNNGLNISCIKITPYRVGDKIMIVPTKIIPLPEAEQYLIQIREKEENEQRAYAQKRPPCIQIAIQNGLLKAGDKIFLREFPEGVTLSFDSENPIYCATITGKLGRSNSICWDYDGKEYSITGLARQIFHNYDPDKRDFWGIDGYWYWANKEGTYIGKLVNDFKYQ